MNIRVREFGRFCVVGVLCTFIDIVCFYTIHDFTGYKVAIIVGFCLSIGANYLLNTMWSFRVSLSVVKAFGMLLAHCFNIFCVRMGLMWLFINKFYFEECYAYIPTMLISVISNFFVVRFVLTKKSL